MGERRQGGGRERERERERVLGTLVYRNHVYFSEARALLIGSGIACLQQIPFF